MQHRIQYFHFYFADHCKEIFNKFFLKFTAMNIPFSLHRAGTFRSGSTQAVRRPTTVTGSQISRIRTSSSRVMENWRWIEPSAHSTGFWQRMPTSAP